MPAPSEAEVGGLREPRSSRPAWATQQDPMSTKTLRTSPVWQCVPAVPAPQEAAAAVTYDDTPLMPAWVTEQGPVSKKKQTNQTMIILAQHGGSHL